MKTLSQRNHNDTSLYHMTGLMVTLRRSRRHRTGQPQLYVWVPGATRQSVYGSVGRYADRRDEYAEFVARHTRDRDERDAILETLDDIASGLMPVDGTVELCTIEMHPAPLSRLHYEVRLGRWSASFTREEL